MKNEVNTSNVDALEEGQTLLIGVTATSGDKIQMVLGARVPNSSSTKNVLSIFNQSDARFTPSNGVRRAWLTAEKEDLSSLLGIDVTNDKDYKKDDVLFGGKKGIVLNVLNPIIVAGPYKGQPLNLEVEESHSPKDEYQAENPVESAKRTPDFDYCVKDGKLIFSNTRVVIGEPNHVFVKHDELVDQSIIEAKLAEGEEIMEITPA